MIEESLPSGGSPSIRFQNTHKQKRKITTMKRHLMSIFLVIACMTLIVSCNKKQSAQTQEKVAPDADLELQYLAEMSKDSPELAMKTVDSLANAGALQDWRADSLRARILSESFLDVDRSVFFAKRTLEYDSVRLVPQRLIDVLAFISRTELLLGHCSESIKNCLVGSALADSVGDTYNANYFDIMMGMSLYLMKNKVEGSAYLDKAVSALEKTNDLRSLKLLSYAYGQQMSSYWGDNTQKAFDAGKKREALIERLATICPESDSTYLDQQRGFLYSKMADFCAIRNDMTTARDYEKKYYETHFSNTKRGKQAIIDFYNTIGDADKYLERYYESLDYWSHKDTICSRYSNQLHMTSTAYAIKGDYQNALEYRRREMQLRDSLSEREVEAEGTRYAALYKTQEKELELEKKQVEALRAKILFGAASLLMLLAVLFAVYYYRQHRASQKKNMLLVQKVDALNYYEQLYQEEKAKQEQRVQRKASRKSADADDEHASVNNDALVQQFNHLMNDEKVYLKSDFSRSMLQEMLNLSKNNLTPVLHAALGESMNLSEYVTKKRVEYACQILKLDPNLTIEKVASDSGFYTARNFRRCFSEIMGMSPSEYKEACSRMSREERL